MANGLSPETLDLLRQRGILPPALPAQPLPPQQGNALGFNPLAQPLPPVAPPPGLPGLGGAPQAPSALPPIPGAGGPSLSALDATNAGAQRVLSGMSPEERQASLEESRAGVERALGGVESPREAPKASPSAQGAVFAKPPEGAPGDEGTGASEPQAAPEGQETRAVSPETEALMNEGAAGRMRAADMGEQAELGEAQARRQANAVQGGLVEAGDISARMAERHREAEWKEQQAQYEEMQREAAKEKPNYGRFNIAQTIGAAIAQGLGAAGAALSHTPNFAAQIIDAAINRHIAEQRDAMANRQEAIRQKGRDLERLDRRFGDQRLADAAERAKNLEAAKLIGDNIVSAAHDRTIAAQWENTRAQLTTQQAQLHDTMFPWLSPGAAAAGQLQAEKTRAEIVKTYAEADKAQGGSEKEKEHAKFLADLTQIGRDMVAAPQTSFTGGNPGNYLTSKLGVQGTQGQQANAAIDAWNTKAKLALHQQGQRLGDPERETKMLPSVIVYPNDNAATRLLKFRTGMQLFGGEAGGAGPGFTIRPPGSGAREPESEGPPAPQSMHTPANPAVMQQAIARALGPEATPQLVRTLAAQAALETGNGQQMYGYNFGGIKGAAPSGGSANLRTTEVENGKRVAVRAPFRAYRSLDEGARDFVGLLRSRYGAALERARQGDVAGYVQHLKQGGYFTDDPHRYLSGMQRYLGAG